MKKIVFAIQGMHCVSCAMNIDGALEDCPGVHVASTNYGRSETNVEFDEKQTDQKALQKIIEDEGYTVLQAKNI